MTAAAGCLITPPQFPEQRGRKDPDDFTKRILLVEDNERDVELTLAALEEYNLANEVVVVGDGAEAIDYLYQRGKYSDRPGACRPWSCWT